MYRVSLFTTSETTDSSVKALSPSSTSRRPLGRNEQSGEQERTQNKPQTSSKPTEGQHSLQMCDVRTTCYN